MTDETESLVLEILKSMQTRFTRMEERFAGFEDQLNGFGGALLTLRIDVSGVRRDIQSARDEVLEALRDQRHLRSDVERIKAAMDLKNDLNS